MPELPNESQFPGVEAVPSVLLNRLAFAFVNSMMENPETIPRSVYRAYGIAVSTETYQITDEQRELVKTSLAKTAASLEGVLPVRVAKQITIAPNPPKKPKK
ncbi:hypothetical protein HY004_00830 [Candidatus Saccharibacteria bacterium]|nr:hypothetical protein [Candidatus Saccharibacteria bacterium]